MALSARVWLRWARGQWRGISTSAAADPTLLGEYGPGRLQPQVVPFQLSPEQAKQEFLRWQRRRRLHLAPSSLLSEGTYDLKAGMLPFWLFSVRARVEFRGSVGVSGGGDGAVTWRAVYASYKYRRDFAEVAKAGARLLGMLRPLPREAASRGAVPGPPGTGLPPTNGSISTSDGGGGVDTTPLDPPSMRQAVAWEFVLRAIHEREELAAEQRLREEHGAQSVRDIHIRVVPLLRQARLAYLPAYVLDYVYGETFNVHGERKAEEFQALVSGAVPGAVAGQRHISSRKASLAAGGLAVGVMGASAAAAPLLGMDPWALVGLEGGFYAVLTAWTAGVGARLLPLLVRQQREDARVRGEEAEMERVVSMGLGPHHPGSPEQEVLRSNAEWRRWERADRSGWQEHKRQRWAEELWRGQHRRRLERLRVAERLRQEAERQQEEDARERRRQKRWGGSSQQHYFRCVGGQKRLGGSSQQQYFRDRHNVFAGGHKAGGRRDFLGYYHLLGLDGRPQGSVSQEDIKHAFRRAALQWHPDKHEGHQDAATKRHARERFSQIRAAFEVLRDPELRQQYDNGQHVKP
ncbi:hypothetical protein N2152v2_001757 [Parachlorella kessleri]